MKTRISALMDGELEDHELAETLRALHKSEDLRGQWCDCQLLGAALRDERELGIDVVSRVMTALELEPTVMVPPKRSRPDWQRPALALAASMAGVALVVWLALAPSDDGKAGLRELAAAKPGTMVARSKEHSTPRLQEYLVAHQTYAPAGAMVGGARNIHMVASSGEGR
ncbi:MAG: sigma-E factor negative regulatory protein [Sulfuritalea sp.]|nr:sigma-E factor negative regulatory protein [Sulfuritalea sp.]